MNLINFIPKKINNSEVIVKELNQKIVINTKGRGRPTKEIILNKETEIDNFLFEIIGLYFGDGLNTRKHTGNRRVSFANSKHELHEYWLRFLKSFGINRDQLYYQLGVGANVNKEGVLEYWAEKLNIPKEHFAKVSANKPKTIKEGVLSIDFNSIIFRKIFDNIFDYCIDILPRSKSFIHSFIAGIFAAEGRVALKGKSLNYLGIVVKNYERRKYVKSLLRKIDIRPSKDSNFCEIIIHGYLNFKIFNDLNIAHIHPDKYPKFNNGLDKLLNSNVHGLTKIKIIDLLKINSKTRYQIAHKLNMDISLIHKMLRDLEIKRIVIKCGKEKSINKSRDIWSLSKIPADMYSLKKYDYQKIKS